MRYAVAGRPVARLVLELCEDRDALPEDRHLLSFEECLAWDSALAPREDQVKAATARLGEIAADLEAGLDVLFGSVDPMPLRVLRDSDLERFRPMLIAVRVERLDIWTGDERYQDDQTEGG